MLYMKTLKAFRLSEEAIQILDKQRNATLYIEDLILGNKQTISHGEALILDKLEQLNTATPMVKQEEPFVPKPPDPETGYPCCLLTKPCKHWQYNRLDSTWVNELTGEVKEVA